MINDFYLRAADLPADTRSLVTEWIEAHPRRLQWAVRRTRQYFGYLDHCNDLTRLAVVLAMLPDTHEKYRQLGIEDTVFAETMSDIGIWCANCGGGGLHNGQASVSRGAPWGIWIYTTGAPTISGAVWGYAATGGSRYSWNCSRPRRNKRASK